MNLCFQNGVTTWLPRYCSEVRGYGFTAAGLMVTVFFLGALIMRLLSPLVYTKIAPRYFYRGALLSSAALFLVFLLVPMPDWAAAAITGVMGLLQGRNGADAGHHLLRRVPGADGLGHVHRGVRRLAGVHDLARGHGRGHRLGGRPGRHAQCDRLHRCRRARPAQAEMRRPVYKGALV